MSHKYQERVRNKKENVGVITVGYVYNDRNTKGLDCGSVREY
jgi:hypothetical protein